jgi:hypothetical protein
MNDEPVSILKCYVIIGGPRAGEWYETLKEAKAALGNPAVTPLRDDAQGVVEWGVDASVGC